MSDSSPATEVRLYDFKSPVRITVDVRKRLAESQAALAAPLGEALSARLGAACGLTFDDVVEGASDRLFETPFDPVFRLAPFHAGGQVFLRLNAEFAQAVIDRLLGGVGARREVGREPTAIETTLLQLVTGVLRGAIAAAWGVEAAAAPPPVYVSASERHATDAVEGVSGVFTAVLGDASGTFELFLSHGEIARTLNLEATAPAAAGAPAVLGWEHVEGVAVALRVQWPPTAIRIRDVAALQVGDVVHLDHKLGDELVVLLGERAAFRGYPGSVEDAFGVRLTRAVERQ